jgi:hypothetical protein
MHLQIAENHLGFIKLLQGYYMLLVTEAEAVAKIGSNYEEIITL